MKKPRRVTSPTQHKNSDFADLQPGDILCGRIPLKRGEEHLLLDLHERGVTLIPSATAQLASRSKCFQARIFRKWMIPLTTAIYDAHQLLETTNLYHRNTIDSVIVKLDRKNGGMGILLFRSIEDVYNHAVGGNLPYPFVIQPYMPGCRDIRVVWLGEYCEAYSRKNDNNLRNNLHCGGTAAPYRITEQLATLVQELLKRGRFPYGFLDFLEPEPGRYYLSEINLSGGLRGASLTTTECKKRVVLVEKELAEELAATTE